MLRISDVAERGGVNQQTIRFYEREGLLPEPPRQASGYRAFPEKTIRRVRFIKRAQELGFSLAEIRELLTLRVDHQRDRAAVRAIAHNKLAQIDEKIRSLEMMKRALQHLTDRCMGHGPASECPILEALDSEDELL